jgi:hypothetical protein
MRIFFLSLVLIILSIKLDGQDCNILSKANSIIPDKLCSPLSVNWQVNYTGVNSAGTVVQIQYIWDDGTSELKAAVNPGPGLYHANAIHTYISTGDKCNYRPKAALVVNGIICASSTQEQIVTVWDDDNHNGGKLHVSPEVYPVCFGNSANVRFQDLTQFNCVPPNEEDVPNLYTRWVQWIYGTSITMTGTPATINGAMASFPVIGPVIVLPGPITGSGVYSEYINVAGDKLIGQFFQVTLRNWNYCNPYDDPNIPGTPADPINGDHPPVVTTAIILIVPDPDATITPVDTLCVNHNPVTLGAHDSGGSWSGNGVVNNTFDPLLAGAGNHIISYEITDSNGCSDIDQITITVVAAPVAKINPVPTQLINSPILLLTATPSSGTWTGKGVTGNIFKPDSAGLGEHVITYQTLADRYGCFGIDTIHIKVIMPQLPVANFWPDTIGCTPLVVHFVNTSKYGESYLWDFGDKVFSTEPNPTHTYYVPGNYIVMLTATSISGQSSHKGLITVYQNPTSLFNIYPTDVINNSQVVIFSNFSYYGSIYYWNFGDGNTSNEENPWHKYESEGKYFVTLTVKSDKGCTDTMRYISPVTVEFKTGIIRYPNAFRWNKSGPTGGYWSDNMMDDTIFKPIFSNVTDYHLQIFNRWGVLIFESHDIQIGWDGYFGNGNLALQGVYVWKAIGQYANGSYFSKVGDVTFLH